MSNSFVSPVGYVDLDNDCEYALNVKSTRGRESVLPKEDLAFYFQTYIIPKYGLGNINVNNVAAFMKDLEMNWSKLDQSLKTNVLDTLVDGILSKDSAFKTDLLSKLNGGPVVVQEAVQPQISSGFTNMVKKSEFKPSKSNFKSKFGGIENSSILIGLIILSLVLSFLLIKKF